MYRISSPIIRKCFVFPWNACIDVNGCIDWLCCSDSRQEFLSKYGYMNGLEDSRSKKLNFATAVKRLQEFGGLPVTGVVDEATRNLVQQKRCSLPDSESWKKQSHRVKRYTLQGGKWSRTNLTWRWVIRQLRTCSASGQMCPSPMWQPYSLSLAVDVHKVSSQPPWVSDGHPLCFFSSLFSTLCSIFWSSLQKNS